MLENLAISLNESTGKSKYIKKWKLKINEKKNTQYRQSQRKHVTTY